MRGGAGGVSALLRGIMLQAKAGLKGGSCPNVKLIYKNGNLVLLASRHESELPPVQKTELQSLCRSADPKEVRFGSGSAIACQAESGHSIHCP